jgi:hypothetical protein
MSTHALRLERFCASGEIASGWVPLLALRGVKGSPPHQHDGRLFTIADSAELFNLLPGLKLTQAEDSIYDLSAHALRAS